MAKYNWKKHKKIKMEFDAGPWNSSVGNFVMPAGIQRVNASTLIQGSVTPLPMRGVSSDLITYDEMSDFNPRIVTDRIETEARNVAENFLGSPNNHITQQHLEHEIVNVMNRQAHQGVINNNFEVRATGQGQVSMTFTPMTSVARMNISIDMNDLGGASGYN